jgi:hypothetical protein
MRAGSPPDQGSIAEVPDAGEVEGAFVGGELGDVSDPTLVGPFRVEVALQQIRGRCQVGPATPPLAPRIDAHQPGVRLIRLGVPWPMEQSALRTLVVGLETVFVIEDKLPFIEAQLKEALYRQSHEPLIRQELIRHEGQGFIQEFMDEFRSRHLGTAPANRPGPGSLERLSSAYEQAAQDL